MSRATQEHPRFSLVFEYGSITLYGSTFQKIILTFEIHIGVLQHRTCMQVRFGLFPFRSPLLWESLFVFFSSGYLDVSVQRVLLPQTYVFSLG